MCTLVAVFHLSLNALRVDDPPSVRADLLELSVIERHDDVGSFPSWLC